MSVIHLHVNLRPMGKAGKGCEADFVVDSRSMNSMAPASFLKGAGIVPDGMMTYELTDGTMVEYPFAVAIIEFMGEITGGRVIFGPEDSEPVLGMTALESVGIVVDPKNQKLKRLPAIPLK